MFNIMTKFSQELLKVFLLPTGVYLQKHLGHYTITEVCSWRDFHRWHNPGISNVFSTGTNVIDDHVCTTEQSPQHPLIWEMPEFYREVNHEELHTWKPKKLSFFPFKKHMHRYKAVVVIIGSVFSKTEMYKLSMVEQTIHTPQILFCVCMISKCL